MDDFTFNEKQAILKLYNKEKEKLLHEIGETIEIEIKKQDLSLLERYWQLVEEKKVLYKQLQKIEEEQNYIVFKMNCPNNVKEEEQDEVEFNLENWNVDIIKK
ncbi:hypothetical protein AN640_02520 [Candidatus Epulonipiscium fishelsonii]|uniref:Uncharacterized protein n=1 Tax=Candidatus Epulonipiscium fishelsonii TaxID=77094 RepID=A0ACC8X8T2_9FIRM|nr:hypothetical protein AN640_02520 [Epulopiscium sp. SCG-D08WGA-EpuloA1]OON93374.1 MAG: hypothetical protein ATN32_01740 [Epulopiscium sp. AS2M-Bin002]